ncbi:hypothetical protein [Planococcus sp. CP5-4_UN]|uniref:hypothetical protein n=1 Tax=Planococcus sp. CP5-4_UN TaxID=2850852 RepID=UPI0020B82919|nr:hypothetical protein [Planococcus sp. CP5-4_UN]
MFESFFEMRATPFSRDIPTADLYESNQLEEIIGRLNYAADRQLFAVMTGECGLGKPQRSEGSPINWILLAINCFIYRIRN